MGVRYVVVQPALEPNPRKVWRIGKLAVFAYVRWSCFAVGVDILTAGLALHAGPLMLGVCHIRRQLSAFEQEGARFVEADPYAAQGEGVMGSIISFQAERVAKLLEQSFALYLQDPPDSAYQRGFLAAQITLYREGLGKGLDDARLDLLEQMAAQGGED